MSFCKCLLEGGAGREGRRGGKKERKISSYMQHQIHPNIILHSDFNSSMPTVFNNFYSIRI